MERTQANEEVLLAQVKQMFTCGYENNVRAKETEKIVLGTLDLEHCEMCVVLKKT